MNMSRIDTRTYTIREMLDINIQFKILKDFILFFFQRVRFN